MKVMRGRVEMPDTKGMDEEEKEHYKFRELMIRNKDKRLYRSMMKNRKNREREAKRLENKRKYHEKEEKALKKSTSTGKELTAKWSVQPLSSTTSDTQIKKIKKDV
jgi:pescadillo protein